MKRAVLEKLGNFFVYGKMGDDVTDDVMGDVMNDVTFSFTDEQNYSSEKVKFFIYKKWYF